MITLQLLQKGRAIITSLTCSGHGVDPRRSRNFKSFPGTGIRKDGETESRRWFLFQIYLNKIPNPSSIHILLRHTSISVYSDSSIGWTLNLEPPLTLFIKSRLFSAPSFTFTLHLTFMTHKLYHTTTYALTATHHLVMWLAEVV